jgi:exosortase D (VPLPA-CTERM-specific)
MNSFRIGVIGLLVDRYGIAQAEGFLHDFEGWVIFMACLVVLLIEIWVLVRLTGDKRSLRDILAIDWPASRTAATPVGYRTVHAPLIVGVVALGAAAVSALALPYQQEIKPERSWFSAFPLELGAWRGHREALENDVLSTLMLDDYILADYVSAGEPPVNFYVAYYASQRSNASAHSPSSCLPGGGWRISEFAPREVPLPASAGRASVKVNRAIIQQGDQRQLVYYWFKERSRNITSEYVVKWYLLLDSLRQHRSDGALVRLVTPLTDGEDIKQADARLMQFSGYVAPLLTQFVPD